MWHVWVTNAYIVLAGKPDGKRLLGNLSDRWWIMKADRQEVGSEGLNFSGSSG
jgi:hypothetical protein